MSKNRSFGEFDLLRRLTETPGVPGREERVRDLLLKETKGLWDETRVDAMGNLICLKRAAKQPKKTRGGRRSAKDKSADGPLKVMIACHMDEIGFYVRYIDDDGRLRLQNAGGFDMRNLFARKVLVQGRKDLIGVMNPGGKPIHIASEEEKKKIPTMGEFFVDLFMSKKEVEKRVQIGDPVTMIQQTEMIGDAVVGKAMDNRVALWVGINAIRQACGLATGSRSSNRAATVRERSAGRSSSRSGGGLKYDTYFVACVQEEVGLRGATTAAYSVDPDVGIAVDTTLCCDTPGVTKDDAVTEFGKGVAIKVMDSASISHRGLFEEFLGIAKARKIPHQLEVLPRGGTDAGALQRARGGSRTITLSIPTRYIHTITEAIHKSDAQAAADLLAAWLCT